MLCFLVFGFSTSAVDCSNKLVFETTYCVSSGTLNLTHSLTHSADVLSLNLIQTFTS